MFIRKRKKQKTDDYYDYSWGNNEGEEEKSHSMWSREIKKLLKKVGLC